MPLFGKKPAPNPKESIQKLRDTIELLEKREIHLQKQAEKQVLDAKAAMAKKDKKTALMCLKRKKLYENQLDKLAGSRMNLEIQAMSLESANVDIETLKATKQATDTMKKMHGQLNIDKIEDIVDDARDVMEQYEEIGNVLTQPINGQAFDEDDLLEELNQLDEERISEQMLEIGSAPSHPIPVTKVPTYAAAASTRVSSTEEDELAALEASMA
ncbi:hypothetical protein PROFUN_03541 [Planoprotostelium fungivorum]|uniref:Uncharacterized protein n=1 Tax=Planoprotostelium fungivorum TaxID=1890364 RepID=A0A2P6MSD5_9EUKA|nr:hypothetical protein PROFUN_03541 [Planoprotostelium fungivorum]